MYIYHALINAMSAHMIHINLERERERERERGQQHQRLDMNQKISLIVFLHCCFLSTETVGIVRDGGPGLSPYSHSS